MANPLWSPSIEICHACCLCKGDKPLNETPSPFIKPALKLPEFVAETGVTSVNPATPLASLSARPLPEIFSSESTSPVVFGETLNPDGLPLTFRANRDTTRALKELPSFYCPRPPDATLEKWISPPCLPGLPVRVRPAHRRRWVLLPGRAGLPWRACRDEWPCGWP